MKPDARLAALLASCFALAGAEARQLNDTGQTTCYDASTTPTGTVGSGNPAPESPGFEGQDCSRGAAAADAVALQLKVGQSSVPGRDYTKIGSNGAALPDTAVRGTGEADWVCTRDNVTGLIWLLSFQGFESKRYTWESTPDPDGVSCGGAPGSCTTQAFTTQVNSLNLCGAGTWALPTPAQLESLFAYENPGDPANLIDRDYFPDQGDDGNPLLYWSQTQSDNEPTPSVWVADFNFGWMTPQAADLPVRVRLVKPAEPPQAPPSPRFSRSEPGTAGHGVVLDAETGLMWKECPEKDNMMDPDSCTGATKLMDWSAALVRANASTFAGFTDWRLPNITELASIRDYSPAGPTDVTLPGVFIDTVFSDAYWSSTNDPRGSSLETAMSYQFSGAAAHAVRFKATASASVRLVRAGNFLATHAPGSITTPGDFSFAGVNAPAGGTATSAATAGLTALTGPASIRVSGAANSAYSINGGSWTSLAGAVNAGDTVAVRHQAASTAGATVVTTVNIGGVVRTFTSTATAVPPGAPSNVVATAGDRSASLTFAAPAVDGGSAITGYAVSSNQGSVTHSCSTPPATACNVTGLTNGLPYMFTVTASNSAGAGTASDNSNSITPTGAPAAPTGVTASTSVGVRQAIVTFTAPADTGGSAITGYTAISSPPGGTSNCSTPPATSCTVTGLSNGTDYTFTVTATNGIGTSAPSDASTTVTTPNVPGAPTGLAASTSGTPGQVTITFTAPASDGGRAITGYTAASAPSAGTSVCSPVPATSCTFSGLANATTYSFTISASNAVGTGAPSAASTGVTTPNVPGAPSNVVAATTGTPGQANISFAAPASNGGSAIIDYTVTSSPGGFSATCAGSPCLVTGLGSGTPYFFTVRARNAVGTGAASPESNSVTLLAAPRISFGNRRFEYPLNHNSGFFFLGAVADFVLNISDPDSSPEDLTIEVSSSNPGLLPAQAPELFDPGIMITAHDPASPGQRLAILRPAYNQSGESFLVFTVRDRDGLTASVQSRIEVRSGNRIPTATYATNSLRLPPNAQPGNYQIPAFVVAASPGDEENTAQVVSHQAIAYSGGIEQGDTTPRINAFSGALEFRLLRVEPSQIIVWPSDSGPDGLIPCRGAGRAKYPLGIGFAMAFAAKKDRGYPPCGDTVAVTIAPHDSRILTVETSSAVVRRVNKAAPAKATLATEFPAVVRNDGALPVQGVTISAPAMTGVRSATWTCSTTSGACSPASGQGAVRTVVDLDLDEEATIVISGTVDDTTNFVSLTPTVNFALGEEGTVFGNGVQRVGAVSNAFVFVGGFEGNPPQQ